ncbi:MAG: RNA-binding protein [Methyloligellaceae bacterium]
MEKSSDTLRQCVVTREKLDVNELVRFVLDPNGLVVPDLKRKLPGRGVWVTAKADKIEIALKKGVFKKAFRQSVEVADDLVEQIDRLMRTAALQRLALTNKAGQLILGFAKVDAALSKKSILALIHASSASSDSRSKLSNKWRGLQGDKRSSQRTVECFSGEQLSVALGKPNVVHGALVSGGASGSFLEAVSRIESYNLVSQVNLIKNGQKSEEV